jgi:hypothetical protein
MLPRKIRTGRSTSVGSGWLRGVLHGGNDAAAAHASQFIFQSLDHRGLSAADAGEQFGELHGGNLQHGAPLRSI